VYRSARPAEAQASGADGNVLDPYPLWLTVIFILCLVAACGCLIGCESLLSSVQERHVRAAAFQGLHRSRLFRKMMRQPALFRSVCHYGIILTSLFLGFFIVQQFTLALLPAFLITAALTALLFYLVHRLVSRALLAHASAHTEEEIRDLIKQNVNRCDMNHSELVLVDNVLSFAEKTAREIMIPRTEMTCLYLNLPFDTNKRIIQEHMHTRYPVCETDKDNIIGFIHVKDFLTTPGMTSLRPLIRTMTKVPESIPILQLMHLMQKQRTHMALLIDEYGGSSGIVTFEDIIEELVGEVHDEFDEERQPIELVEEGVYSVDGLLLITEVNRYFDVSIDTDWYDTIGGWMYANVGSPPEVQAKVSFGHLEFIVEETEHLRISRILVRNAESQRVLSTG